MRKAGKTSRWLGIKKCVKHRLGQPCRGPDACRSGLLKHTINENLNNVRVRPQSYLVGGLFQFTHISSVRSFELHC